MTQKTIIVNGEEVPVYPAKAEEEVKNKRTGKVYASKDDFDNDVADANTDTVADDLQINQKITVASLEVFGKSWSSEQLAENLNNWQMHGQNIVFLVGGPEGLAQDCKQRANQNWSLSNLTLPHPLVRVIVAESLYRAWTITVGHPYHRGQ